MTLDIHHFDQQYRSGEQQVRNSEISTKNKELIMGYRDACILQQVCGKVRLPRVLIGLLRCARILKKDFSDATKEDLQRVISVLLGENLRPPTIATYKAILKRFMSWVLVPDEFPHLQTMPPQISWITSHVRKRDERRLQRNDLLTPADIEKLLSVTHNPRDQALISILWETGCRIAEVGNLQLKHVSKTQHGYTLDVNGKTGQRSPIIISSAPYLSTWLANHPFKNDPEAPLWVYYQYTTTPKHLQYDSIRHLLDRDFHRAGITKPFHPHIFRHSRATYVLANAIMNEAQAKAYFGWTPDSGMLGTYSHLIDQDANNAVLRENNLAPLKQRELELRPIECRICKELNQPKTDYCTKCGAVLDLAKAYEHQRVHQLKDEVVLKLFKVLVQRGLIDEAAQEIHDAGLGPTLQQLARHHDGTAPLRAITVQPEAQQPTVPGQASSASPQESR